MAGIVGQAGWRKVLYRIGITFGLGLLAYQTWQGYVAIQQYKMCVLRPTYLIGIVGLYIAAYFVQMVAWALIMRSLQAPLSPNAVLKGYVISFLPRYIPGTVWGYLSRNEWLAQTHQISYGVSTVASLLEAALLLATATIVGAFYWVDTMWKLPIVLLGILGVGIIWVGVPWAAARWGGKRLQVPPERHHSKQLGLLTTLLYLLFWGLQGGAILYIGDMLCANSHIMLLEGMASMSLAWALGFVILFVPAGLGIREWSLGALLVAFTGIEPGQAVMVAIVSRVAIISSEIVVLIIGLIVGLMSGLVIGLQRTILGGRKLRD